MFYISHIWRTFVEQLFFVFELFIMWFFQRGVGGGNYKKKSLQRSWYFVALRLGKATTTTLSIIGLTLLTFQPKCPWQFTLIYLLYYTYFSTSKYLILLYYSYSNDKNDKTPFLYLKWSYTANNKTLLPTEHIIQFSGNKDLIIFCRVK